ncbi:DUF2911 domain-containing protein [soil metagenome]
MKKSFSFIMLVLVASVAVMAQEDMSKRPSPPAVAEGTIDGIKVKINYSAPSVKGRKIFGSLEKYGDVWRTGANETTTIEFSAPVKIEGKTVAAGKYALFSIPGETEWTIIINTGIKWGTYTYKKEEDVIRVTVKPTKTASLVEVFNIAVEKSQVVMKWENTQVAFKVAK